MDMALVEDEVCNPADDTIADNLQPSGVLNHEAMRGQFSLRHVLGAGDGESQKKRRDGPMSTIEDPINAVSINLSVAKLLFQRYVEHLRCDEESDSCSAL